MKKTKAQADAIQWLKDVGGCADFSEGKMGLRASNNRIYYAGYSFWKRMPDDVELINNEQTVRIKSNAV